ncbi:N-acetylmuramoyl-L-alanine amidase [Rossellomorea marisflavi]|uniref:N-acetylmuramoyl-L-alanine amidase n=1 Tax=Rossellomorea marisflavi TaxID=189381 RepID=UPI00165364E1|nr:N-acetylmuramoyl-L-alanine amidase [Rossellomorea marisflavi]
MTYKITQDLLTPNPYSRPKDKLKGVRGIVIHWVANKSSSAKANRNFFENRKSGNSGYGSAHYIIDLDGSVIQCLPDAEVGYHVGSHVYTAHALNRLSSYPNNCTIGIELTHTDWEGRFTKDTYDSALELAVKLLKKYGLDENDLWLHHTVVGWKDCARWFVNNNSEWVKFKTKAGEMLRGKADLNKEVDTKDMEYVSADKDGYYTIKNGDTFWGLSQALDVDVKTIEKLNPKLDAKSLKVGQKVKIKETKVAPKPVPAKPSTPAKKGDMKTTSIVTFLQSIGENSSISNREKLAIKFGIQGYKGTAEQNLKLLDLMRKGVSPTPPKVSVPVTSSGIKVIGKIKIVGVTNAAVIQNVPDRKVSKSVGTIAKNSTIEIAGSVKGNNNVQGYWEVIYKGKRAYVSAQFGKLL